MNRQAIADTCSIAVARGPFYCLPRARLCIPNEREAYSTATLRKAVAIGSSTVHVE